MIDMQNCDGVIFDMDGVIFDSERASIRCWLQVCSQYGISDEEIWAAKLETTGTTVANSRRVFAERFGHIPGFDYTPLRAEYEICYNELLARGEIPVKRGARALLEWLHAHGKRVGLASSTNTEKVMRLLHLAELEHLFDSIIGGDQVRHSKPDPEIYRISLERLALNPDCTYGIEDSYNGIRSLHAAGIHPIMVPDILPETREMRELADAVYPDLEAVLDVFAHTVH
ncbi:MAG: HAD family phosphatase [Clostridia bacterium]|nr:HAD family phosphatase [Clostridia bacterium]